MAYVLSNDNRFYVALEQSFGTVATIAAANRIPAVKLTVTQRPDRVQRRDKTGSRTFPGNPAGLRKTTTFELATYMTTWTDQTAVPPHGPLFQAGLGSTALHSTGGAVASSNGTTLAFSSPHGLAVGQAISSGGEIRFAAAVTDAQTIQLNAPLSANPAAGAATGPTTTYQPISDLGSVSIFDYWSPGTAVQRILCGAAVDKLTISVNGDFHEFAFSGQAQDLLDTASFQAGQGALTAFPAEPATATMNYSIIPGHLGQVWLGSTPDRFFTVTKAKISFQNNLDLRAREFGTQLPLAISAGQRSVSVDVSLYQQDTTTTAALYQAARQRSPVSMMIQLGQQQGQLFGIYMQSVVVEVPEFDDSDRRQQWQFQTCRAQGTTDNELFVAFA